MPSRTKMGPHEQECSLEGMTEVGCSAEKQGLVMSNNFVKEGNLWLGEMTGIGSRAKGCSTEGN